VYATQNADFTLSAAMDGYLIPVGSGVVITVPTTANVNLRQGFSAVICQMGTTPASLTPQAGAVLNTPNGLVTQGQFTVMSLAKLDTVANSWIVSTGVQGLKGDPGTNGTNGINGTVTVGRSALGWILFGGAAATYAQSGYTVTVTKTTHNLTAAAHNGQSIYLTQSTGTFTTEMCTNVQWVSANSFTCTSAVSRNTSGNLGSPTGLEITLATVKVPANLLGATGGLTINAGYSCFLDATNGVTIKAKYGGTALITLANVTNNQNFWVNDFKLYNRGVTNKQVAASGDWINNQGKGYSAPDFMTVDTTQDSYVTFTVQFGPTLANYSSWIALQYYDISAQVT
jgi:hypothetical protein